MEDFTFKQRVSDDFSTFPKCGMFRLHQDAEYLIVIINRRVRLRNCWLFISNKVSPLSRNPDDPSSEKAGYKGPTYKLVTSSCNSILIRFKMFPRVSRPKHSSGKKKVINIKTVPP